MLTRHDGAKASCSNVAATDGRLYTHVLLPHQRSWRLKKVIHNTLATLPHFQYVIRSDIKGYYASINFDVLLTIIVSYVKHPALLRLIIKACHRTETHGGIFYDYNQKGIPMGLPLSTLLGAIALIPLDLAMGKYEIRITAVLWTTGSC